MLHRRIKHKDKYTEAIKIQSVGFSVLYLVHYIASFSSQKGFMVPYGKRNSVTLDTIYSLNLVTMYLLIRDHLFSKALLRMQLHFPGH